MIILNPEFHRNLWLKFSVFRLAAMPILVGMVAGIVMTQDLSWANDIYTTAMYTYYLVVFLWGNFEAAATISSEGKNNTWDFQRMSSIGPWELSMGKLFGSVSYVWYFGITLLLIIFVSDVMRVSNPANAPALAQIAYLALAGIMAHATAITASIENLKRKNYSSTAPFLSGFIVGNLVLAITQKVSYTSHTLNYTVNWYGMEINPEIFMIGSLLFFFVWVIVALQRKMREELQFTNSPIAWTLFTVLFTAYLWGYMPANEHTWQNKLFLAKSLLTFIILSALLYIAVYGEAHNLNKYKRFFNFLRQKSWLRAWENTPMWATTLLFTLAAFLVTNILAAPPEYKSKEFLIGSFTASLLLFILRDGLALHFVLLNGQNKHKKFMLVFYYLMVYFLLPFLCLSALKSLHVGNPGWLDIAQFKEVKEIVTGLFLPTGLSSFWISVIPPLAQALLAGLALKISLRRMK